MNVSITGCALDEASGKRLTSPDARLYRIGVLGEILAVLDEHGCFSFSDLSPGEYSLAVYAPRYVTRYERLTLKQDETIHDLQNLAHAGWLHIRAGGGWRGTTTTTLLVHVAARRREERQVRVYQQLR